MTEQVKVEHIIRNTRKYWYVDGLSEIAGGLIIFIAGLTYWFVASVEQTSGNFLLLTIAQPAVIILGSLLAQKIFPRIKDRITYPRTGYLTFRKPPKNRRFRRILIIGLIAAVVGALVTMITSVLTAQYLPFLSSVFLTVFSIYIGYQTAVPRFYWIAFLMLVLGAAISFLNPEGALPYTLFFCGIGVIWIVSGVITLILYLKQTSPQMGISS